MAGRPRIELDIEEMIRLIHVQCTQEEIAYVLGVSIDTVSARVKELYGVNFPEFYKKHIAMGKMSLRRSMFKMSETNASMAIWLSKQYLGMREPQAEVVVPGESLDDDMAEFDE